MPLTVADLTAFQANPAQRALDLAIARVEEFICPGVPGILTEASRTVVFRLEDIIHAPLTGIYSERRISAAWLKYWPITSLTSVKVDGVNVTGECVFDRFSIRKKNFDFDPFAPGEELEFVFKTGWADPFPAWLTNAILTVANGIQAGMPGYGALVTNPVAGGQTVRRDTFEEQTVEYFDPLRSSLAAISAGGKSSSGESGAFGMPEEIINLLRPYRLEDF